MSKNSLYVNKNLEDWVLDEVVYAYAGGALIQGTNPVLVLTEVSALGKHIIGLPAVLFNNENILTMIAKGVSAIIAMIILCRSILHS